MALILRFLRSLRDGVMAALVVLALILALVLFPENLPDSFKGPAKVIDGDSLEISGFRVRLIGVDAPEGRQTCRRAGRDWACGRAATRALRQKISSREVSCDPEAFDQYDRVLARCRVAGENLNGWLVANGWAISYGGYSGEEQSAKNFKLGIWAGEFQLPREWREQNQ